MEYKPDMNLYRTFLAADLFIPYPGINNEGIFLSFSRSKLLGARWANRVLSRYCWTSALLIPAHWPCWLRTDKSWSLPRSWGCHVLESFGWPLGSGGYCTRWIFLSGPGLPTHVSVNMEDGDCYQKNWGSDGVVIKQTSHPSMFGLQPSERSTASLIPAATPLLSMVQCRFHRPTFYFYFLLHVTPWVILHGSVFGRS